MDYDHSFRRVLVIAYYFPPLGLSGVQRVAGFVKHLPSYRWHPTVITARPAGYFAYDEGLRAEIDSAGVSVFDTPSLDPTRLFRKRRVVTFPHESVRRPLTAFSRLIFTPDNKIGWFPFAVSAARRLHRTRPFDAIFSSAPPYSAAIIAQRLARRFNVPLVLDFRDDWVDHPIHRFPTRWHRMLNVRMEYGVLRTATRVLAVNRVIRDSLASRSLHPERVVVLPHGHDIEVSRTVVSSDSAERKMQFLYTGVFYDSQTPDYFLRALATVVHEHPGLAKRITARFLGLMPSRSQELVTALGLQELVQYGGYVPHSEAVRAQLNADVLWMTVGDRPGAHGITTSKLSEYMGCQKPILALIPPGDAEDTLAAYKAARIVRPTDVAGIARAIVELYHAWNNGTLPAPDLSFVQSRSRKRITGVLAQYLDLGLQSKSAAIPYI